MGVAERRFRKELTMRRRSGNRWKGLLAVLAATAFNHVGCDWADVYYRWPGTSVIIIDEDRGDCGNWYDRFDPGCW